MALEPRQGARPTALRCVVAITALVLMIASAAAAQSGRALQRTQLQRSVALWNAQHLRNYTFRIQFTAFPVPGGNLPVTITVRNGRPSDSKSVQLQHAYGGFPLDTVPNLFKEIRHVLSDPNAGKVVVHYDRRHGFPVSASIDPTKAIVDDEFSWTIDQFRSSDHVRSK
ncbi:MAG: DUF6174 domain-containing protein [Actinomycetota bacterium]|nr:DUF6174 domain-containing protein [Actinomycetota bacterium]